MGTITVPTYHACGLGIDAGGTSTRWALANVAGEIIANGNVAGMTALQMGTEAGRQHIREALANLATAARMHRQPMRTVAGITGLGEASESLRAMLAGALGAEESAVILCSDIEIAYLDVYAAGEGYVVYAGTGSIAAFIDANGTLHRAGGHGVTLDDAGGGFWIARKALQSIWRGEDEAPGCWRESPMAREIFSRIGGSEWAVTREFVYGSTSENTRGEIGRLALAVAMVAGIDPVARRILQSAGEELARLARALIVRFGPRPVTLSGRVAELHPAIAEAMCAALPASTPFLVRTSEAHFAAARIAANGASTLLRIDK